MGDAEHPKDSDPFHGDTPSPPMKVATALAEE